MITYPLQPETLELMNAHNKLAQFAQLNMNYTMAAAEFRNEMKSKEVYLAKQLILARADGDSHEIAKLTSQLSQLRMVNGNLALKAALAKVVEFRTNNPELQ